MKVVKLDIPVQIQAFRPRPQIPLEMEAGVPAGVPNHVVRVVTENGLSIHRDLTTPKNYGNLTKSLYSFG